MLNSLRKSSPSSPLPGITAVEKVDVDGMSATSRSGEKTSKGRGAIGGEGEGAMISRRNSSITLSLTDLEIGSSATVVAVGGTGVVLSSGI